MASTKEEHGAKRGPGRPTGISPRLKGFLVSPSVFAALSHLATERGTSPEIEARALLYAATWRSPESVLSEMVRVALEKGKDASTQDAPEDEEAQAASSETETEPS